MADFAEIISITYTYYCSPKPSGHLVEGRFAQSRLARCIWSLGLVSKAKRLGK